MRVDFDRLVLVGVSKNPGLVLARLNHRLSDGRSFSISVTPDMALAYQARINRGEIPEYADPISAAVSAFESGGQLKLVKS